MGLPMGQQNGGAYRCGSNTSSSSGRGSSTQHASLPRNPLQVLSRTDTLEMSSPLSEVPIMNGLPTVSGHLHHNLAYKQPHPNYTTMSNYYYRPPPSNSHYRGPPTTQPRKLQPHPLTNAVQPNDYAILKFNANGNVGKEIDV